VPSLARKAKDVLYLEETLRVFKSGIVISIILILSSFGYCDSKDELIEKVLSITGITKQFNDPASLISGLYTQNKNSIDPKYYDKISKIIITRFSATAFNEYIKNEIGKDYNEEYLNNILKDYADNIFLEITQREIVATPEYVDNEQKSRSFSEIPKSRQDLIAKFISDSKIMEMTGKIVSDSLKSYFYTYNLLLPKSNKITEDQISSIIGNAVGNIESDETKLNMQARFAIIYEKFSDEALKKYFGFYRKEEGIWLQKKVMDGFEKAFEQCMNDAAQDIAGVLKNT
jgi:hypothetical protein